MKKIAFYLPQFHTIPENDMWWGNGFTEWVNVRNSIPQFEGHIQPEVPLDNDYYDLSDVQVQVKQAELAKLYGLDGFCYYHYWFEGKMLLEKPMEHMLHDKRVDIPFCICWANETWARTWDGQENNVLIKQNYDEDENAWKEHFQYFLQFFQDERYIRYNGKPMLVIYKPHLITNCKVMLDYWRQLAIDNGLDGIYLGYQHHSCYDYDMGALGFDFGIEFEPFYTVREFKNQIRGIKQISYSLKHPNYFFNKLLRKFKHAPVIYDYDRIWRRILSRRPSDSKVYPGAFPSWDNTPRRGNDSAVFKGATPEKFSEYLQQQVKHAKEVYKSEYLFINAWNEWAEGAHLEPDEYNKYGYLEAIKKVN